MNISMQLAVVAAVCLCLAEGAPDIRVARAKQQRPTRGFKNVEMMTARGFGKRDPSNARAELTYGPCDYMGARGMGKRNDYINDDQGTPAHKRPTFRPKCWSVAPVPDGKGKYDICQLMTAYGMGKKRNDIGAAEGTPEVSKRDQEFRPTCSQSKQKTNGDDEEVYGLDNFWEMLEASPEREGQDGNDEKALESIPQDWFVNEMLNNPDFTRSVVRKFIDLNQDGQLTSDELLRNVV